MYLTLAWRNIWRNKRRSLISISSVIFAVIIAIAMRSMQLGFYSHSINNVVSFYTGYLQVHRAGFWEEQSLDLSFDSPDSVALLVEQVPHVTFTAPRLESFALVSAGDITDGAQVIGIDPAKESRLTGLEKKVVAGRYLMPEDDGILLAQGIAAHLGMEVGDTVILLGQGYHGISAAGRFTIVGTVEFPAPELNSSMAYLALAAAQYFCGAPDRVTSLAVMIDRQDHLSEVETNIRSMLDRRYEVISWETMMPEMVQYITVDNISGIIMLGMIYVVIGFGILGTVLMMTLERIREFGMLLAVGMKRRVLQAVAVIESVILSLVGALAGMVLGVPLLLYLHHHPILLRGKSAQAIISYGFEPIMPFSLDPWIFVWQTIVVLIIALAASGYPVLRIRYLDEATAIRKG